MKWNNRVREKSYRSSEKVEDYFGNGREKK